MKMKENTILQHTAFALLLLIGTAVTATAQISRQLNVTLKGGNTVTYEIDDIDSLWFSKAVEEQPGDNHDCYAITVPDKFLDNDVLRVMAGDRQVAQICLEYINKADARLTIVYPVNDEGVADLSRGWCANDGGTVVWDTEADTCKYTPGNGTPQSMVYLREGDFVMEQQTGSVATTNVADLIVDKRGDDEKTYRTVKIGTQYWMAQNLDATKYLNNQAVTFITSANTTAWRNNTTGAYHIYADDTEFEQAYGAMYNGHALSNPAGLAPMGWDIPSVDDFKQLRTYLGSQAGLKMKSDEAAAWNYKQDAEPNNLSGFSALAAGYYLVSGDGDYGLGTDAWFWTSTEYTDELTGTGLNTVRMNYGTKGVTIYENSAHDRSLYAHSVRCIKKQ